MRTENRVVLASPELRMAPLGSDNFDPNADLRTRQYTLNQEKSGLDFGVHYTPVSWEFHASTFKNYISLC